METLIICHILQCLHCLPVTLLGVSRLKWVKLGCMCEILTFLLKILFKNQWGRLLITMPYFPWRCTGRWICVLWTRMSFYILTESLMKCLCIFFFFFSWGKKITWNASHIVRKMIHLFWNVIYFYHCQHFDGVYFFVPVCLFMLNFSSVFPFWQRVLVHVLCTVFSHFFFQKNCRRLFN